MTGSFFWNSVENNTMQLIREITPIKVHNVETVPSVRTA